MAAVPVALTTLTLSTWVAGTTAGTLCTAGDTAEIAEFGGNYRGLIAITNATSTVTVSVIVEAGDNPPSLRAGLGAIAVQTIAVGATWFLALDGGRFTQNDAIAARITLSGSTDAQITCRIQALRLARGA